MENQSKQDFVTNESIKKEQEVFKKRFDQALEQNIKIVNDQNVKIQDLTNKIVILAKENLELKQRKVYVCDECDFEGYTRETISNHKYEEHERNESESEEEESTIYQCDLCEYNSGWPDNVAFHYREIHKTYMNWEEAESRLKK